MRVLLRVVAEVTSTGEVTPQEFAKIQEKRTELQKEVQEDIQERLKADTVNVLEFEVKEVTE